MKYAEEIAKEIKERGPIDTTGYMVDKDDAWENYIRGNMNKPNNLKCDTCFVINNPLRCWNCKYKTKEWKHKNVMRVIMRGEKDLYKSKTEKR